MGCPAEKRVLVFLSCGAFFALLLVPFFQIAKPLSCGFLLFAGSVGLLVFALKPRFQPWCVGSDQQEASSFGGFVLLFAFLKVAYLFFGFLFVVPFFSRTIVWLVFGALLCLLGVVFAALPCFERFFVKVKRGRRFNE